MYIRYVNVTKIVHLNKTLCFPSRTPSRASTTSSEEVTYTFGDRDIPLTYSPSEGYLSYPQESLTESGYSTSKRGSLITQSHVKSQWTCREILTAYIIA